MGPFRMGIPLDRTSGYEKFEVIFHRNAPYYCVSTQLIFEYLGPRPS